MPLDANSRGGGGHRPALFHHSRLVFNVMDGCGLFFGRRCCLLPIDLLHREHTTVQLSAVSVPPREWGMMWSTSTLALCRCPPV